MRPLTQKLSEEETNLILSYKTDYEEKRMSILDIARAVGRSKTAVTNVLTDKGYKPFQRADENLFDIDHYYMNETSTI